MNRSRIPFALHSQDIGVRAGGTERIIQYERSLCRLPYYLDLAAQPPEVFTVESGDLFALMSTWRALN
jgi:hypothetical protein